MDGATGGGMANSSNEAAARSSTPSSGAAAPVAAHGAGAEAATAALPLQAPQDQQQHRCRGRHQRHDGVDAPRRRRRAARVV